MSNSKWDRAKVRYHRAVEGVPFYAVIKHNSWIDSSFYFSAAIYNACNAAGQVGISPMDAMEWLDEHGFEHGYSIVHSRHLPAMYEQGLLTDLGDDSTVVDIKMSSLERMGLRTCLVEYLDRRGINIAGNLKEESEAYVAWRYKDLDPTWRIRKAKDVEKTAAFIIQTLKEI
jgi:hypothetical protein